MLGPTNSKNPNGNFAELSSARQLNWTELDWIELNSIEFNWVELNWIDLIWIELNWFELKWFELIWIIFMNWIKSEIQITHLNLNGKSHSNYLKVTVGESTPTPCCMMFVLIFRFKYPRGAPSNHWLSKATVTTASMSPASSAAPRSVTRSPCTFVSEYHRLIRAWYPWEH